MKEKCDGFISKPLSKEQKRYNKLVKRLTEIYHSFPKLLGEIILPKKRYEILEEACRFNGYGHQIYEIPVNCHNGKEIIIKLKNK